MNSFSTKTLSGLIPQRKDSQSFSKNWRSSTNASKILKVSKSFTTSSASPGTQSSQVSKPFTNTSYFWAGKLTKGLSKNTSGTGSSKEFIPTLSWKHFRNSKENTKLFTFCNFKPSSASVSSSSTLSNNMRAISPARKEVSMLMSGRILNSCPSAIRRKFRNSTIPWKRCLLWPPLQSSVSRKSNGKFQKKYSLDFLGHDTTLTTQLQDSKASFSTNTPT